MTIATLGLGGLSRQDLDFLQPLRLGRRGRDRVRDKRDVVRARVPDQALFILPAVTDRLPAKEAAKPAARVRMSEAPLESLAGCPLAENFHSWLGKSGRRYICSVFPVDPAEFDAGLPDFADAVVMAVARGPDGSRRIVSACQCEPGANPYAREAFRIEALAGSAVEWHVHLLAMEAAERHAMIADIEAMRHRSLPRSEGRGDKFM
ncbi:MAG TPA: hypothetical protein VKV77_09910 [Methylovirgula sp.]|nr:hypothetical protein [Methylovirgula sp.]